MSDNTRQCRSATKRKYRSAPKYKNPTIKTVNTIDVTGNENEAEDEDGNEAENEDKNEHEDLEEATKNNGSADVECNGP